MSALKFKRGDDMASGKLLRLLIKSGMQGDSDSFKAASEAVIREEREKKHHLLANDLERLLYGDRSVKIGRASCRERVYVLV